MNNIYDVSKQACTGCGICGAVCPIGAIILSYDKEGFYKPRIDEVVCVECGICKKNCLKYSHADENINFNEILIFSVKNNNAKDLAESTSGGASIELMRECLDEGYKVVGVCYDYGNESASTQIANNIEELEKFKGSKYFQSCTQSAFSHIVSKKGKYAVFGTPCQIFALRKWANSNRRETDFIFVDIFCHGCPSINLWRKSLKEMKESCQVESFERIKFRCKDKGWHNYCNSYIYGNNNKIGGEDFFTLFMSLFAHNKACYDCSARDNITNADIRIGDFWGKEYFSDTEGVSLVVVNSEKGKALFNKVSSRFQVKQFYDLTNITKSQSSGKAFTVSNEFREMVLEKLQSDCSLQYLIKEITENMPLSIRIKKDIGNIVRKILPARLYLKLRFMMTKI